VTSLGTGCDSFPEPPAAAGPRAIESAPSEGQLDVDRRVEMRVRFERPILPRSLTDETVGLASGPRQIAIATHADPLLPGIVITPIGTMDPDARWELRVEGLRDLDGRPAQPLRVRFTTGATASEPLPAPIPPWSEIGPLLTRACAGCHSAAAPALGLDLSSAEGVRRTAIGVAAREVTAGPSAVAAPMIGGLGGMRRIEVVAGVGIPEESYLVYKLIGDPHIVGDRMPPPSSPGDDGGAPGLTAAELRRIEQWIRAGASTE
jgi:hypothetical protein